MKTHYIIRGVKLDSSYSVINDKIFKAYANDKKNNSEKTMKEYRKTLDKFCKAIDKPLNEIIDELKMEQSVKVEEIISQDNNKTIIRTLEFDVNSPDSTVKKYHHQFESYCLERGNKNSTANKHIKRIRTLLKANDIKLPKWEFLKEEPPKWELLEKEDIKFVLDECSIIHKSLILFMLSSGMRVGDCVTLTIGDFMKATRAFHDFVDAEDFIDNAPQDMMGFWSFEPGKTERYDIKCKTFNSPESSNIILQNIRRLKNEYYPRKRKRLEKKLKDETDEEKREELREKIETLKISKNNALFGSRNSLYTGPMKVESISTLFPAKNKKLCDWRISKIRKAIEDGKISAEDYEKEVKKIPRFHAHACRKYFETMISRNCGDLRICTLMESHASPVKTDPHYIKKEFDEVQEIYLQAIEDLTIENVDSKLLSNKKMSELESRIESLTSDTEEKDQIIKQQEEEINNLRKSHSSLDNTVEDLSERLKEMDKQLKHLNNNEPQNMETKSAINSFVWFLTHERISNGTTSASLNNIDDNIDDEFENISPEELENWDTEAEKFLSKLDEHKTISDELSEDEFTFSLNDDEIDEIYDSELGKQLRTFNQDELLTIQELTYEIASNEINFKPTAEKLLKINKNVIFKMKRNPDLIIKVRNYHEDLDYKIHKHAEIFDLLDKKIEEIGLWDEDEATILKSKIIDEVMQNRQYVEQEITEDMVMDLIEQFM